MNAKKNEFERHRRKFYALIGHCVTGYQSVEDYLPELFAAALGGDTAKAAAILAVARGLEAKLDIITAALIGTEERCRTRWIILRPRVAKAAEARNQIAHATPTHNAGLLHVTLSQNRSIPAKVRQVEDARMELRKRTRVGETVWTVDLLQAEWERTDKLFGNLIALAHELRGETPPAHLISE